METLPSEALVADRIFDKEKRLYDDTTTWLAEVLDGQMRTSFEYSFDGHELYADDGSSLRVIFDDALEVAGQLSPELAFEERRRQYERDEYDEMIAMMKGSDYNTMVVVSDFPPELMTASHDVGGYNVERKQTMLRVISKTEDDKLSMTSYSLDRSDRKGLKAIYEALGYAPHPGELLGQRMHLLRDSEEQAFLGDQLTGVYDRSLEAQMGGIWYAGRRPKKVNTYDFVRSQKDLLGVYLQSANAFGDNPEFLRDVAATMKKRYEQNLFIDKHAVEPYENQLNQERLLAEILDAAAEFKASGKSLSGCGLTIGGENQDALEQLSELGYGNTSQEDKYGSLTFKCQKGHKNTRPRNRLIPRCKTCGISVKC